MDEFKITCPFIVNYELKMIKETETLYSCFVEEFGLAFNAKNQDEAFDKSQDMIMAILKYNRVKNK